MISNNKVDGLLVNYDDISNDYDYYIPVVNQAISLNYKTVSDISDIKWKSYQDTITSLEVLSDVTQKEVNVKVEKKIVSKDNMIVGLLTHYQEILPIKPISNSNKITKELDNSGNSRSLNLTKDLILMRKINDERLSFSKKYNYEKKLYQQIRYEVSRLLQLPRDKLQNILKDIVESNTDVKNQIKRYISNDILTFSMKNDFLTPIIDKLLSIIVSVTEDSISEQLSNPKNNALVKNRGLLTSVVH